MMNVLPLEEQVLDIPGTTNADNIAVSDLEGKSWVYKKIPSEIIDKIHSEIIDPEKGINNLDQGTLPLRELSLPLREKSLPPRKNNSPPSEDTSDFSESEYNDDN